MRFSTYCYHVTLSNFFASLAGNEKESFEGIDAAEKRKVKLYSQTNVRVSHKVVYSTATQTLQEFIVVIMVMTIIIVIIITT